MKPAMLLGVLLIILGVVGLLFPVINYTTREPVNFLGYHLGTVDKQNSVVVPSVVGGLLLVGGIAVVVVASRKGAANG